MLPLRRLLAVSTFSLFAVLTLSLGIGGTMATYAVAEAVLFRPLDIDDVDRVVHIHHHDPSRVGAGHLMAYVLEPLHYAPCGPWRVHATRRDDPSRNHPHAELVMEL